MTDFYLDDSAITRLNRLFRESECAEPVAMLNDVAVPSSVSSEITRMHLEGRDRNQIEKVGNKLLRDSADKLRYMLDVSVYERSSCEQDLLITINGFDFSMNSDIFDALSGYCLVVEGDDFLLRGSDGTAPNLSTVLAKYSQRADGLGGSE